MELKKNINDLASARININIIEQNYEDILRLAYSIKEGLVSSSLILSKLGSYSRQNSLAKALQEMGRIEKTIFILRYATDSILRRRILVGLNKGEAMNGLARAVFFGKQGELRERDLQDQLQRASALTYRNSTPPELQTRGLTIRIRDNKAYFCISGSISLADLQTLCERCQAGQSPDQCKK